MLSTMQDHPLIITDLFTYGRTVHSESTVATFEGETTRHATFAQVADRAERLAAALARLGVQPGDRVATYSWNSQEHLEAYFAVPCMGAVLHTLNIRLFPEQLVYIANHAEDEVVIVEDSLVPALAKVRAELKTVKHVIVVGSGDASALGTDVLRYEELLAAEKPGYAWPAIDERSAAAMCYTSGTTGNPKGVVYSHRSTWLHSLAVTSGPAYALTDHDKVLLVVPMFHANAWGLPYAAWQVGADLVMPARFLQAAPLARMIAEEKPTIAAAVPTIWNDVLRHGEDTALDLSSLRLVVCGGSAVPRMLMERFQERYGVRIIQAWGMTEMSPFGTIAFPPKGTAPAEEMTWRTKTGRMFPGVELRIVDDSGNPMPWDGTTSGEIEVRGPWITGAYYQDPAPDKFRDGWLRTGDVGTVDAKGFMQITDRAKDVIKSGGEWISSVELENEIMAHPDVVEAAVIGIPDERWQERPLACVVLRPGKTTTPKALQDFLATRVARWWLPESFAFIPEVPKTSVGKFDKKVLRARHAEGGIEVVPVERDAKREA
jgi:fatty-acyl-CoA synthase